MKNHKNTLQSVAGVEQTFLTLRLALPRTRRLELFSAFADRPKRAFCKKLSVGKLSFRKLQMSRLLTREHNSQSTRSTLQEQRQCRWPCPQGPCEGVFVHSLLFAFPAFFPFALVPWSRGPLVPWSRDPLFPWSSRFPRLLVSSSRDLLGCLVFWSPAPPPVFWFPGLLVPKYGGRQVGHSRLATAMTEAEVLCFG